MLRVDKIPSRKSTINRFRHFGPTLPPSPCFDVSSLIPGHQEPGKINAEEGAGDRDEAGDGKMSDLASGRLAENDSTDPGGETGRQLLNGGVYAHESAAMASLDAGGHQSHRRNEPAGHTNHEQGGDCHGNHQRHGGKICDQQNWEHG